MDSEDRGYKAAMLSTLARTRMLAAEERKEYLALWAEVAAVLARTEK